LSLLECINVVPHVLVGTLAMTYISFEMRITLTIVYILVKMCLALHVPFETLIMVYILVRMCLALHVPFETLIMVYILIKMNLALHLPFRTLIIAYIPFKTCLNLAMVNILDVLFETHTKFHCNFQIMENVFHYNPM
jgi:hypothetical protein